MRITALPRDAATRFHAVLIAVLTFPVFLGLSEPLKINKVEPPNWWAGMKWNQVQLMLYGEGLTHVVAKSEHANIHIRDIHPTTNPNYAFLDLTIADSIEPGTYTLRISNENESLALRFPILKRPNPNGRYQGFGPQDVIYLITPDRFCNGNTANDRFDGGLDDFDPNKPGKRHGGDLEGIIQHLDYLQDLGVTALWLNPILENAGRNSYHGYAATDLYRVDPRFGSNDDYRRLVDKAHQRDLKIIFDHINNHIGIRHPWIENLPMDDWLNGTVEDHHRNKHYKNAIFDPHADPKSEALLRAFWFVDAMPDLNQRNPFLANYLIQNTLWWIETTGLDGIREDTYVYPDQAFLARWAKAILDEYPNFNIVGEIWTNEPALIAQFQQESLLPRDFETNLPCVMDFPLMNAFRAYFAGTGKLRDIYAVISQDFLYSDINNLLVFMDNHDTPRGIYISDQNVDKVKQVLTMVLTTRGIPQLLYGTEINLLGGQSHIELRQDFPGGFPSHTRSAFTDSGRTPKEREIFDFTQKLLHLRKAHPALSQGRLIHYPLSWNNDIYNYLKIHEDEIILILVNGHAAERVTDLSELSHQLVGHDSLQDLLNGHELELDINEGLRIGSHGIRILRVLK